MDNDDKDDRQDFAPGGLRDDYDPAGPEGEDEEDNDSDNLISKLQALGASEATLKQLKSELSGGRARGAHEPLESLAHHDFLFALNRRSFARVSQSTTTTFYPTERGYSSTLFADE
jgi:hypothetical protein